MFEHVKDDLMNSALIGVASSASLLGHSVACTTKNVHGTWLKLDGKIIADKLRSEKKLFFLSGVVAAGAFFVYNEAVHLFADKAEQGPEKTSFVETERLRRETHAASHIKR